MTISRLACLLLASGTAVVGCGRASAPPDAAASPTATASPPATPDASPAAAPDAAAPAPDATTGATADAPPAPTASESWACSVVTPGGVSTLLIRFTQESGAWHASADVMGTEATGLPLTDVALEPERLAFTLTLPQGPPQTFALTRAADAREASGTLTVAGQAFYTKAQRLADGEAPHPTVARPQTPAPPYPYDQREVVVDAPEGGKLAGTLTLPKGAGPFPAVLLISGSGQQDRDETIFGHRPFRLVADRLTRAGLAVLRVDDRATGKSQGALGSLETDIGDARAAFELLLAQPEIDPKRVGLLGHSIGGAIAPIVAARTKKVAFIVSLAGTAMPGSELVQLQMQADLSARGAPPEVIAKVMDIQKKIGAVMLKGDPAELRAAAAEAIRGTYELNGQPAPSGPDLDKAVDAKMVEVTNPWTLGYFRTDPREAWREVTVPVLVLMGAKDTQVPPASQLPAVVAALKEAKNADVTAREVPGLNHLFQHADKGIPEEYGMIEETFDPQTLEDIATWLRARTHLE